MPQDANLPFMVMAGSITACLGQNTGGSSLDTKVAERAVLLSIFTIFALIDVPTLGFAR